MRFCNSLNGSTGRRSRRSNLNPHPVKTWTLPVISTARRMTLDRLCDLGSRHVLPRGGRAHDQHALKVTVARPAAELILLLGSESLSDKSRKFPRSWQRGRHDALLG